MSHNQKKELNIKLKEDRLKMCLWWTQDVWPRFLSRKDVLFQVLAVWSVGSLQLSASSELRRVASPKNMQFSWAAHVQRPVTVGV